MKRFVQIRVDTGVGGVAEIWFELYAAFDIHPAHGVMEERRYVRCVGENTATWRCWQEKMR